MPAKKSKGIPPPIIDVCKPVGHNGEKHLCPPTFAHEEPDCIPENFKELPKEKQDEIMARLRGRGIRLRPDLKDFVVPLTRQTMDLP